MSACSVDMKGLSLQASDPVPCCPKVAADVKAIHLASGCVISSLRATIQLSNVMFPAESLQIWP